METELIVRNLLQHYGDERFKWFAHSPVGSPRILNQLGVFVDIKTRIGCPRPPLRTPQWLDASGQSGARDADSDQSRHSSHSRIPVDDKWPARGACLAHVTSSATWPKSFPTRGVRRVTFLWSSNVRCLVWSIHPIFSPRCLDEREELILRTARVNDGQIKTHPPCLDKGPYVTWPTCLGVMTGI